ncbi:polygalacturonase [Quercus suber]|uniref:Polygalacturonase n=1 Tax=Quercus suber TaxID=58331 RepID=A0AAW0KCQ6_QUESU
MEKPFGSKAPPYALGLTIAGSKVVISVKVYKLGLVTSLGPSKGVIAFQLQRTLQALSDVATFNGKDGWVIFECIDGLTVSGGGVFDGKGQ